jgi:undecaprenyl-diphosphatase
VTRPMATWGAMAFLVCLVGFGLIAWQVSQPGIPPLDTATTAFLHGLASPTLDAVMNAATFVGSSPMLAAVVGLAVVLLLARRRRAEAVFIVVAFVGTLVLNDGLKSLFQRPRPGFDWAEVWPETGFPSGHSMDSFVVYLAIALVIWRLAGRRMGIVASVLALGVTISVGISRIYLGAHWLSDVIGGYLAAMLWLLLLVAAWALVSRLRRPGRHDASTGDGGSAARVAPTRLMTLTGPGRRP